MPEKECFRVSKREIVSYLLAGLFVAFSAMVLLFSYSKIRSRISETVKESASSVSFVVGSGMAFADAADMTAEEIEKKLDENKVEAEKILKENDLPVIYDFTAEEEAAILSGELSSEDAENILLRKNSETDFFIYNSSEADKDAASEGVSSSEEGVSEINETNAAEDSIDKSIGEKVTRLYSLKAYYMGLLGNMLSQAESEYKSAANGDKSAKELAKKYFSQAGALEAECDSKVYAILSELENELSESGRDTSVVASIEEAYLKEKRLKKSYYLTNYMN